MITLQYMVDPRHEGRADHTNVVIMAFALAVLIANDFILKPAFGTWWTGKLSDFAGLLAFSLFWGLLFKRWRVTVLTVTAVGFVYWKSPASMPLIDSANQFLPFTVGRVADWTDCAALVVLPVAAWLLGRTRGRNWVPRALWEFALIPVAIFAFIATSGPAPTEIVLGRIGRDDYEFDAGVERLGQVIDQMDGPTRATTRYGPANRVDFEFFIPWHCADGLLADTRIRPTDTRSALTLIRLTSYCPDQAGWTDARVRQLFEDSVVASLRRRLAVSRQLRISTLGVRPGARQLHYNLIVGSPGSARKLYNDAFTRSPLHGSASLLQPGFRNRISGARTGPLSFR
jgi:hypothetical protein